MEWSLDYCLVCDRQTVGGAYCSQACRLAELDQLSPDSASPSDAAYNDQLLLEPVTTTSLRVPLTLSSSQTSLSSLQSSSSQSSPLPDRVRDELRDYASCFDQVRAWKRRLTS